MKTCAILILIVPFLLNSPLIGQDQVSKPKSPATQRELTIEAIFAEGGLLGRAPEAVKWSPDGSKVSYVQRDDSGEHGALYYVDCHRQAGGAGVERKAVIAGAACQLHQG